VEGEFKPVAIFSHIGVGKLCSQEVYYT